MTTAETTNATVLAFDFGTRRVGIAVGNTLTRSSRPLATIEVVDAAGRLDAIARVVAEWQPALLIVGLPTHADGTPHAMTAQARRFAHDLRGRFGLPVALVDERWTSEIARAELREGGRGGRADRTLRDQVAARIILQAWLDQHGGAADP